MGPVGKKRSIAAGEAKPAGTQAIATETIAAAAAVVAGTKILPVTMKIAIPNAEAITLATTTMEEETTNTESATTETMEKIEGRVQRESSVKMISV